jgi:tRNA modification GTPase
MARSDGVSWAVQTPPFSGALAIIQLVGPDAGALDALLQRLGMAPVVVGGLVLRDLLGVDRGVVARWSPTCIHLMPHGGSAVVRGIAAALEGAGVARAHGEDPGEAYPEATEELEARTLAALARASSPLAIDLLLDQPRRWRELPSDSDRAATPVEERDLVLNRLLDPPLVVAVGPPNVGKSSLVNALAGRGVSIAADEPGTTRDHVGVLIDLGGLVVRWVDTPGLGRPADQIARDAEALARGMAERADLLLLCGDSTATPPSVASKAARMVIAVRADLGLPQWPHAEAVSVRTGGGVADLVTQIRDTLVPPPVLADARAWKFW